MIATRIKQGVWALAAVAAALVAAALAISYYGGIAEAQSLTTAPATAYTDDTQTANRNKNESQPASKPVAHLVVNPGDSLWSISQERLHPSATDEQIMNEVEQTFELNRNLIGDDPNLILPGQEILLPPPAAELPAAAAPKVSELEVAEQQVPELISEPVVLPDLPEVEAVPEAPEITESSFEFPFESPFESYADKRQLFGLGIIALTLMVAILMARTLPIKRNIEDPMAGRISRGYYGNHAPSEAAKGPEGKSESASVPLITTRSPNNYGDRDSKNGYTNEQDSNPLSVVDARVTPHRFSTALSATKAFKESDDVSRGGVGSAASTMLLLMAEDKNHDKDYYTPPQAARILRLSRQRVTQMLQSGEMEGKQDPESGRWKIPQRVVHARLKDRPAKARPDEGGGSRDEPEGHQRLTELELEVRDLIYRLGRSEARLELTESTESTLRAEREKLLEDLERERRRADRLEAELQDARRPWWRKMFRE